MEFRFNLLFPLFYSALPATVQTEEPAEIVEALRKGGPYAEETWRELRPVIWSPGAWLLEHSWVLTILLSLLVWIVAGRITWAVIKKFIIPPINKWGSEGGGKHVVDRASRTCDRFTAQWEAEVNGPVGERMFQLGGGMLALPISLVIARNGFAEGADQSSCIEALFSYGLGAVAAIVGLGIFAWVLLEVGRDAYKSIASLRQPGVSIEYPYNIRVISFGLGFGVLGLALLYIGSAVLEFGIAHFKDMEVLAGVAIAAVGVLIILSCFPFLFFSVLSLTGPTLHALAILVMWPVVIYLKKGASEVLQSDERENPE